MVWVSFWFGPVKLLDLSHLPTHLHYADSHQCTEAPSALIDIVIDHPQPSHADEWVITTQFFIRQISKQICLYFTPFMQLKDIHKPIHIANRNRLAFTHHKAGQFSILSENFYCKLGNMGGLVC